MDTPLAAEIRELIAADGPVPVSRYMALCLGHPRHGYYMTRDPFGTGGDFTTAPEISQVFGELLGIWAASVWDSCGRPSPVRLVELGPGRGTLMADLLRAAGALPAFHAALDIHLVETSPVLAARQRETLKGAPASWHADIGTVPPGPTILIANELLDALPVRQFAMTPKGWRERVIGLADGRLAFGLAPDPVPPEIIPEHLRQAGPGAVYECCPAFEALCAALSRRASDAPLAALFIDYGHAGSAHGETLQAVKGHGFVDPLAEPGEADLTAHVDFEALGRAARAAGLAASPISTQREFLFGLGLASRAEALARANPAAFETVRSGVERLVDPSPTGMGALFKTIVLHESGTAIPVIPERITP
ncbi:MAG: SAM-dependent methyltransferase [Phreatobacter sp.]|uniref:class I SAM-dependent methyltransferase n=1 Tax=Phreatobacter sp. TaxID=1966341 RepID=UPI001A3BEEAB|nr:SAM-dependent methyltransferase [Phreatobacter sp.]MBL8569739.1 SAM-dependent methyltransferase [Phreatobacter sp.]